VLFVPGSEIRGFLIYPMASILDKMEQPGPEFIQTVTAGEGMIFLSHIEERAEHPVDGLTGLEIYNRHWDARKDMASLLTLAFKFTDPKELADLVEAARLYPAELLAFQCDYPQVYVDKWDAGTRIKRLTGIAANDCHHNQIFIVKMVDADTVLLGTNVDEAKKMRKLTTALRPGIREMTKGRQPGDLLARLDMDPYHRSFWNVCTHVLAPKLDEPAIRAALKAGHAYVAHDWMCDATGFDFAALAVDGTRAANMGDEVTRADGLKLAAKLPVAAYVRLLRHGEEVAKSEGQAGFTFVVKEPGAYRLEAWLKLDDELRPWIFSNPIYVR
ncbi:MAG: histidinol phosphatase, partial [Verrucomicrobiota bacterium]|nr:histidinol phosphatase [Verrucomicrobiota bacterium]